VGSVSYFAITVVHPPPPPPPPVTNIGVVGTLATWTARELARFPMPPASPNRYVLIIEATQMTARRPIVRGDTDDITVTVTNSSIPADTDSAGMDGVFGP
jgi:hypothetical protein